MEKLFNKQTLMIVGAGVALVLLYYWWQGRSSGGAASSIGTVQDPNAADYSQLSGQEASDIAGLASQESQDAGNLTGQLATASGQEQTDYGTVQGEIANIGQVAVAQDVQGRFGKLFPGASHRLATLTGEVGKVAREVAREEKQLTRIAAGQRRDRNTRHRHAKAGGRHRPTGDAHANSHHPAGTAGRAVGQRTHATKRARAKKR